MSTPWFTSPPSLVRRFAPTSPPSLTLPTFHVFQAAKLLRIHYLVWASSETLLGYPFAKPPVYVPLDEEVPPTPEVAYSLAKDLEEEMARQLCRWNPDQKMMGCASPTSWTTHDYAAFPAFEEDPASRKWNLWSYIDARDGAQAVVGARSTTGPGSTSSMSPTRHRDEPTVSRPDGRVLPRRQIPDTG